jgi:hypothetical protein
MQHHRLDKLQRGRSKHHLPTVKNLHLNQKVKSI